jgi:DNA-binding response OmpR family regulator
MMFTLDRLHAVTPVASPGPANPGPVDRSSSIGLIVVVEDETELANAIAHRLRAEQFAVEIASDGPGGVEMIERLQPDLVVLDIMLPGFDGLEVCRRIQRHRRVPVIMLTARAAETDLVVGLAVGADDYLAKPFSPRELVARVHAVLRRSSAPVATPVSASIEALTVGDVVLDLSSRQATRAAEVVHLTATEFDLAVHLASHESRVFTREQLLQQVWGYPDGTGARTVDSHIQAVRRKLGHDFVRTVHGVGYALGRRA